MRLRTITGFRPYLSAAMPHCTAVKARPTRRDAPATTKIQEKTRQLSQRASSINCR